MLNQAAAIIDANLNRAAEGLRVIEDDARFVLQDKALTVALADCRKTLAKILPQQPEHFQSRNTHQDQRAKEKPASRKNRYDLLCANFKRVTQALRVLEEYSQKAAFSYLRYDVYELEKTFLLRIQKPAFSSGIYAISDQVEYLLDALKWKPALIQYRDNNASKESVFNICKTLQKAANAKGVAMMVNNYLDIALLLDADGLHTGQDDLPVDVQRQLLGDHKLIGKTTHSLEQGLLAQKQGADYVSVGPLWETPSKLGRKAIGFDYLKQAKKALNIPYVAIGGINSYDRFERVMKEKPPLLGLVRELPLVQDWLKKYQN